MLYEEIKSKRMKAKVEHNDTVADVLTVLLGEVDRIKDTKGTDDAIIIACVNKMYKSADESFKMNLDHGYDDLKSKLVMKVLDEYKPKSLNEEKIREVVERLVLTFDKGTPIGTFMKELKLIEGMDMKIASSLLKEFLK